VETTNGEIMVKRRLSVVAVLVAVICGASVGAAPASAAMSDCPNQYLCLWQNTNYSGTAWRWSTDTIPGDTIHALGTSDNQASSVYNHRGNVSDVFKASSWTTGWFIFCQDGNGNNYGYPTYSANLANLNWNGGVSGNLNDSISSIELQTGSPCS
jgi:hypothetical protein